MKVDASEQIDKFQEFFSQAYNKAIHELMAKGQKTLEVDFFELTKYDPDLAEQLLEEPAETIKAAEMAVQQADAAGIRVRFHNLPQTQRILVRNLRHQHLAKLICLEGIIRQSSDVRPEAVSAKFECPTCGNALTIMQTEAKFREPSRCSCGRKGHFRLLSKQLVDIQRIVIEESPELLEGGAQPKRLSVFLREDLVEPRMEKRTVPGTKIRVTGVLDEVPIPHREGGISKRFDIVLNANHIELVEEDFSDIEITKEDEDQIKKLAKDPEIYDRLVRSIAPSIFGHDQVKTAILLQMFGGIRKEKKDGTVTRGDIHVLLVGDPGVSKSQMLTFVNKVAPKSRYVAGKASSAAGLTASVVKDEFLRGWALEAGAIVLADKGILCMDEFDKMSEEDSSSLHQALEQQTVTIAKANIQACYSSDTEVLTDEGWKKYQEVKNAKLAQYDPANNTIKLLPHNGLFVYGYKGKLYHFKNNRNDILVTPNHKMLTKEYRHKTYMPVEADDLTYDRIKFLNSGNFVNEETKLFILPPIEHKQKRKHPKYTHQHNPKKIPMDLWVEFLGYYLTEGGIQKKPTFGIPQKSKAHIRKIKKCLSKLADYVGFTLSETKDGEYVRFQVTNTQLFEFLAENCGQRCSEKRLPIPLSSLSKRQMKILYDAMMLGDGSSDGRSFGSTSIELIDMFQAIACLAGKSVNKHVAYKEGYRKNRSTFYRVSLSIRTEPSITKEQIKKVDYDGKVFCFSTKTGFFITRRNGKVAIQGNTLRAQTSVLAAANPKLGRFDPYSPLATQIEMPLPLLSRFDLIFVMRDIPNKALDTKIAEQVLRNQSARDSKPEIDSQTLRKYLAYVKQKIFPVLTDEAMEEIQSFYVELRSSASEGKESLKPIPLSPRNLEAVVRLSEASARIRLSNKVTKKDARKAIDLMHYYLLHLGVDPETGKIDIDRITTGITTSTRGKIISIRDLIYEMDAAGVRPIPVEELLKEAISRGIKEQDIEEAIDKLKRNGDIFEPKKGFIQKI